MHKFNIKTIFSAVIAGSIALCLAAIIIISDLLVQVTATEMSKTRLTSITSVAASYAAYTIAKNDDLALMELMTNLSLKPGVVQALVTDKSGLIIAHTQSSEIGKVYRRDFQRHLIREKNKPKVLEWSYPLTALGRVEHILHIAVTPSPEVISGHLFLVTLIILAIIIVIISCGLAFYLASKQDKKVNQWVSCLQQLLSTSAEPVKPNPQALGNWGQLTQYFDRLGGFLASGNLGLPAEEKRTRVIAAVLSGIGNCLEQPVIMLDAANRMIFVNSAGKELMLNDQINLEHLHDIYFPEVCRNAELIEAVKQTVIESKTPVMLNLKSPGKVVKINFLTDEDGKRLGVVIIGR